MNWRHLRITFVKDGLEMLRDKRTLFVNLVLPVLLYPVLTLITLQVLQLTRPGPENLPRLALVDTPLEIDEALPLWRDHRATTDDNEGGTDLTPRFVAVRDPLLAERARRLQTVLSASDAEPRQAAEQLLLDLMRKQNCVALLIELPVADHDQHRHRLAVLIDNAHRDAVQSRLHLREALERAERRLLQERLAQRGLAADFIEPLVVERTDLAPRSEAARTRIAGFIPVILLLMAISGAFYPALDLIAGERERGTLETLLSWPGDRHAIFTGKLLVVMCAALASVLLNLVSLGVTAGIIGSQLPAEANVFGEGISIGPLNLLVGLALLVPLTLALATIALALAGMATSFKEAQNYLSPFMLVVMTPGMLCLLPQVRPGVLLDMVPVLGPLVVLKASLQSDSIPWEHVLIAFIASTGLCAAVVQWSVSLLGRETFLYPSLMRRGWGRFAQDPVDNPQPSGVEAVLLWLVVLSAFLMTSAVFQESHPLLRVTAPLVLGVLLPTLAYTWLGGYRPGQALRLQPARPSTWLLLVPLWALTTLLAAVIGALQIAVVPIDESLEAQRQIQEIFTGIGAIGGLPLLLVALALTPGVCEEALFRGPVQAGFQRSLGRSSAVVLGAVLFGLTHMSPARFFPQLAVGLVAGALVLRCRSVLPAMALHTCFNAGMITLGTLQQQAGQDLPSMEDQGDLFALLVSEIESFWPAGASLLRDLGPQASFGLGLLLVALLAAACWLVIRLVQPHHRAAELGDDQAPARLPSGSQEQP